MAITENQKPNPVAPKPDQLSMNAERHTKAELARALFDVLDGNSSVIDIVRNTGMSVDCAAQINKLFADLTKNV